MPKTAILELLHGNLIPSGEQISRAVKTVGPPALGVGAGLAGLKGLLSILQQNKEDQEQREKGSPSVLRVEIPQEPKMAGVLVPAGAARPGMSMLKKLILGLPLVGAGAAAIASAKNLPEPGPGMNPFWDDAMYLAPAVGGVGLGYAGVNSLLEHRQKQQLQNRLEDAKGQYAGLLGQSLAGKTAELDERFALLQGMAMKFAEDFRVSQGMEKEADGPNWASAITSAPSGVGLLAALLSHQFIYNRMKEVDAMHAYEKPKPPKSIQLVSAPPAEPAQLPAPEAQPEAEKIADYHPYPYLSPTAAGVSNFLGGPVGTMIHGSAAGDPIQGLRETGRSLLEGGVGGVGGGLLGLGASRAFGLDPLASTLTGTALGGVAGGVHGAAASAANHNHRQEETANVHDNLFLHALLHRLSDNGITAQEALHDPNRLLSGGKGAELEELLGAGALASLMGGHGHSSPERPPAPARAVPHAVNANTSEVLTPEGNITVTATDPGTAANLPRSTQRLAKILAGIQAQPDLAAA